MAILGPTLTHRSNVTHAARGGFSCNPRIFHASSLLSEVWVCGFGVRGVHVSRGAEVIG